MDEAKVKAQVIFSRAQLSDLRRAAGETEAAPISVSPVQSAEGFFAERKGRGDKDAAMRFMTRGGGEPPREGDELP